jgi:putative FmdB family regulatory protein
MPIYEFVCDECGKSFESLVIGYSTDNVKCPDCESSKVIKKISSFAVSGSSQSTPSFSTSSSCATGST